MHFAYPQLLWLLAALPLLLVWRGRKGRAPALRYPSTEALRAAGKATRPLAGRILPAFRILGLALLIVAIARPQEAHSKTMVKASGVDLVLAVDVSGSMRALDMQLDGEAASRLDVVKSVVKKFVEGRPNDRIGVVAFAGKPYLVSPLTLDHDWLLANLSRLEAGLLKEDGTAIGDGLTTSVNRLRDENSKSRLVVLITDGVNNTGTAPPNLAADAAAALGIKVHTIGVGVEGKAPMPVEDDRGRTKIVMMDADVDEKTLASIADKTGGTFYRATDTGSLEAIYQEIDQMEKTTRDAHVVVKTTERFAWAALPAFALLGLELAFAQTLMRRNP